MPKDTTGQNANVMTDANEVKPAPDALRYGGVCVLCSVLSLFFFTMIFSIAAIIVGAKGLTLVKSAPRPKLALTANILGLLFALVQVICSVGLNFLHKAG